MKKTSLILALSATLFGFVNAANATNVGVSVDAGTTGVGIHLIFAMQLNLNARLGVNALNYNNTGSTSQAEYDFKLKLQTYDALIDWFPQGGSFRLTGGLVYNGNKIESNMRARDGSLYVLNGNTYSASQVGMINGSVDFKKIAPYLGIGWGNAVTTNKGWGFSADLGVIFQGAPNSTLTNSSCTALAATCKQLAIDIAGEKVNLDNRLSDLKAYPVLSMGVTYGF